MTGRGAGFCAGFNTPGFANPMVGGGRGMGWGRGGGGGRGNGRGWRNMYYATGQPGWMRFNNAFQPQPVAQAPADPVVLQEMLQQQAVALQGQLDVIRQRLDDLSAAAKNDKKDK
jgi:hypothetical protein